MVACVSTVALLAGCGANERDEVQAKVAQFVHAIAGRDYRTLCTQVLAPSLLTRLAAGGIPCDQAMQISLSSVHDPLLSVGRVTINGSSAQAITLTGAAGERGAFESINLIKTGDGWRISSLAAPRISSARG
jgi:hypothetical protein